MRSTIVTIAGAAAVAFAQTVQANGLSNIALLFPRQDEQAYIDSVCTPSSNETDGAVAPCQEVMNIEAACATTGTSSSDYLAYQECMCDGSFFDDWDGCLNCQYVHGSRSEAEAAAYSSIIASASVSLCTGTPTADFAAIFSAIENTAAHQASGLATTTSDQYPSDAAISLYYTATGSEGPAGSAASATSAASSTSASGSSSSASSSSSRTTGSTSSRSTGSSSATMGTTTSGSSSSSDSSAAATTSTTQTGSASRVKAIGSLAVLVGFGSLFAL